MLDSIYAQVMRLRRRRVERRPHLQRRLTAPVISVGNLSVGGTGKTPVVAEIARRLIEAGHRPSILSRGYGRADAADGVVVVADGTHILAPIDRAGDEPLMLARQVPGAVVCVSPDRHLAGTLAERRFGCTVHLLDDGFQHIEVARSLDVLVSTIGEITTGRVLPMGRLREPKDAAARAHFLVVSDATAGAAAAEAWTLGIQESCGLKRTLGAVVSIVPRASCQVPGAGCRVPGAGCQVPGAEEGVPRASFQVPRAGCRVLAVAGIGHPQRFFEALKAEYNVVETMSFGDHHRYTAADVAAMAAKVKDSGAEVVLTTDKDAVRLEPFELPFAAGRVPLRVEFDPPDALMASVMAVLR